MPRRRHRGHTAPTRSRWSAGPERYGSTAAAAPEREIDVATGEVAGALPLPDWDGAAGLAREAGRHLLPRRPIRFDIALTPGGPVLVGAGPGHR